MKIIKVSNIILLNLSVLCYYLSYVTFKLEYIYFNIPNAGFLVKRTSVILICDIFIGLAICILLVVIILTLTFGRNKIKILEIIEVSLISLGMLVYLGSHLLEALAFL